MQGKPRRTSKEPIEMPSPGSNTNEPLEVNELNSEKKVERLNQPPNNDHPRVSLNNDQIMITTDIAMKTLVDEFKVLCLKCIEQVIRTISNEFPLSYNRQQSKIARIERRLKNFIRHVFSLPEEVLVFEKNLQTFKDVRVSEIDQTVFF